MAFISNCAEGGTDGTTPTSGNTAGASGTALDNQTIGSGCTLTFESDAAYAGSLGYRYVFPAGNVFTWQRLNGLSAAGRVVLRFWFRLDSVPTATEYLCSIRSASAQACVATIGSDGKIVMQNAAGSGITSGANGSSASSRATNAISANTWYRMEISITKGTTSGNGSIEYAYYLGNSGTAEFAWTGTTNVNAGTANITNARLGRITSASGSEARTMDIDGAYMLELASGWYGADPVLAPGGISSAEAFGTAVVNVITATAPSSISSAEAIGTVDVTIDATDFTVEPTAIASAEALGTPVLDIPTATEPTGIATAEALGTPALDIPTAIVVSGIATDEAVGTPALSIILVTEPPGIATGEALGSPTLSTTVTTAPTGIASDEAFGTLAVSTLLTVSPLGIESTSAFGTPALSTTLTAEPAGIASGEAIGTPILDNTIRPDEIFSAEAFGSPVLTTGLIVSPTGIDDSAPVFGTPVLHTSLLVTLTGIASAGAVGTPVVIRPPTTVSPAGIASGNVFGTARQTNILVLFAQGIATQQAIGTPSITRFVIVSPTSFTGAGGFGSPTATLLGWPVTYSPGGIASGERVNAARATGALKIYGENVVTGELITARRYQSDINNEDGWEGHLG